MIRDGLLRFARNDGSGDVMVGTDCFVPPGAGLAMTVTWI